MNALTVGKKKEQIEIHRNKSVRVQCMNSPNEVRARYAFAKTAKTDQKKEVLTKTRSSKDKQKKDAFIDKITDAIRIRQNRNGNEIAFTELKAGSLKTKPLRLPGATLLFLHMNALHV